MQAELGRPGGDCLVECIPGRCCLEQGDEEECSVLHVFGRSLVKVPTGESRTLRFAAPLLDQFDRRGYCVVHLHSKSKGRTFKDTVILSFDTGRAPGVAPCSRVDQNPLNDCRPVDCDTYYNGQKPYFNSKLKKCVKTPPCSVNDIYDARSNKCVQQITEEDIRQVNSLIEQEDETKKESSPKELTGDEGSLCRVQKTLEIDQRPLSFYFNWDSTKVLTLVVTAQCFFLVALGYCVLKRCKCPRKERDVKLFCGRVDSDTTPLLSTKCGTATTCQFETESSSSIGKKIKRYKARRKEKQAKTSMSDDILSRCLKRRDWSSKPKSFQVVREDEKGSRKETEQVLESKECESKAPKIEENVPHLPKQMPSEEVCCLDYDNQQKYHENAYSISRDSLKEFIPERGFIFLQRDFEESRTNFSSGASSKNNVAKVLSLYRELEASSDPGRGKEDDVTLLHMSRVSMFSSSASVYTALKRDHSRSSV